MCQHMRAAAAGCLLAPLPIVAAATRMMAGAVPWRRPGAWRGLIDAPPGHLLEEGLAAVTEQSVARSHGSPLHCIHSIPINPN
eukprot:SAG31_NODE_2075_length_6509_cov_2.710764_6_plen_83_part_00